TGNLITARELHASVLLGNGMVLVVGGSQAVTSTSSVALNSSELYNPGTGAFTSTGNLNTARTAPATVLSDGTVLVTAGFNPTIGQLNSAELYSPSSGAFTIVGSLHSARAGHAAVLLNDGRVLVSGGSISSFNPFLNSAETYNPATRTFSVTGNMNVARSNHT